MATFLELLGGSSGTGDNILHPSLLPRVHRIGSFFLLFLLLALTWKFPNETGIAMGKEALAAQIKEVSFKRQTQADHGGKIHFLNEGGFCCGGFVFKQYKINNNKNQAAQDNSTPAAWKQERGGSAFSAT